MNSKLLNFVAYSIKRAFDTPQNVTKSDSKIINILFYFILFFIFLSFSRATPVVYGGSQARGLIRAVDAGPRQSHSNAGSEPHLRPTPQLTAMLDP